MREPSKYAGKSSANTASLFSKVVIVATRFKTFNYLLFVYVGCLRTAYIILESYE